MVLSTTIGAPLKHRKTAPLPNPEAVRVVPVVYVEEEIITDESVRIETNVRGNRHDTLIFYIKVDNKKSGQGIGVSPCRELLGIRMREICGAQSKPLNAARFPA